MGHDLLWIFSGESDAAKRKKFGLINYLNVCRSLLDQLIKIYFWQFVTKVKTAVQKKINL